MWSGGVYFLLSVLVGTEFIPLQLTAQPLLSSTTTA